MECDENKTIVSKWSYYPSTPYICENCGRLASVPWIECPGCRSRMENGGEMFDFFADKEEKDI